MFVAKNDAFSPVTSAPYETLMTFIAFLNSYHYYLYNYDSTIAGNK